MENLKAWKAVVLGACLAGTTALAGQDGNGGFGVLCKSPVNTASGIQLPAGLYTLDHFEGLNDPELTWDLGPASLTWQQKIDLVAKRVRRFNFELAADLEALAKDPKRFVRISDDKVYCSNDKLIGGVAQYSLDIGSTILPSQCDLTAVARNISSCGSLGDKHPLVFIFEKRFNRMGNDSKAAIVLHEYLFAKYRDKITEGDSTSLRNFVVLLASKELQTLDFKDGLKLFIDKSIVPTRLEIPDLPGWYLKVRQKAHVDLYDLEVRVNSDGSKTIGYKGAELVTRQAALPYSHGSKDEAYQVFHPNTLEGEFDRHTITVGADGHVDEQFLVEENNSTYPDLTFPKVRFGRKVFTFGMTHGEHQTVHQKSVDSLAKFLEAGGNLNLLEFQDGELLVRSMDRSGPAFFRLRSEPGFPSYCITADRYFESFSRVRYRDRRFFKVDSVCKSPEGVVTVLTYEANGRRYLERLEPVAPRKEIFGNPKFEDTVAIDPDNYVTQVESYNDVVLERLGLTGSVTNFVGIKLSVVNAKPACGWIVGYQDLAIVLVDGRTVRPFKSKDGGPWRAQLIFDSAGKISKVEPYDKKKSVCVTD